MQDSSIYGQSDNRVISSSVDSFVFMMSVFLGNLFYFHTVRYRETELEQCCQQQEMIIVKTHIKLSHISMSVY